MEERYKFVFVVLIYKNVSVVKDFFLSLEKLSEYKVIVVNSFFDTTTEEECERLALSYKADYISVENKGYGFGNNIGIQHAIDNYKFEYLVVSNSDIIIKKLDYLYDHHIERAIISPNTVMKNGKRQNPCSPYLFFPYIYLLKKAYYQNSIILARMSHIFNRLSIWFFFLISIFNRKEKYDIFMGHGSFIIFTYDVVILLNPIFNNNMFLYNEELYLGLKARFNSIPIFFIPDLKVLHFEGASAGDSYTNYKKLFKFYKSSFFEMMKESFVNKYIN